MMSFDKPISRQDVLYMAERLIKQVPALFENHITITGGTGLFGAWLIQCLDAINVIHDVRVHMTLIVRDEDKMLRRLNSWNVLPESYSIVVGDLSDKSLYDRLPLRCEKLFHLASLPNFYSTNEWFREFPMSSMVATYHLCNYAKDCGVSKIVYASSGGVYDMPVAETDAFGAFRVTENSTESVLNEKKTYGMSKRLQESMLVSACEDYEIGISIARCFAFIGPYLNLKSNYAIGNFLNSRLLGDDIAVNSDGLAKRDYMYMADLAVELVALSTNHENFKVVNVGGQEVMSFKEVASIVANEPLAGLPVVNYSVLSLSKAGADYISSEKGKGIADILPVREAVLRTLKWYKK